MGALRLAPIMAMIALGVAACQLVVSTSDLAGGSDATEPDGGELIGPDASTLDGAFSQSKDVSTGDSAMPVGDATTTAFCPRSNATFCADFDEGFATTGFSSTLIDKGGVLGLSTDGRSPPAALSTATTTTNFSSARLVIALPGTPSTIHVEFDARVCVLSKGYNEFMSLEFGSASDTTVGAHDNGLALATNDGVFTVGGQGTGSGAWEFNYNATQPMTFGKWMHFAADIVTSTTGSVRVSVDGNSMVEQVGIRITDKVYSQVRVLLGSMTYVAQSACESAFDNFVVTSN